MFALWVPGCRLMGLQGNRHELLFPPPPASPQSKTSAGKSETVVYLVKLDLPVQVTIAMPEETVGGF